MKYYISDLHLRHDKLTVRDFLSKWVDNVSFNIWQKPILGLDKTQLLIFNIWQKPILEVDKTQSLIFKKTGTVDEIINSNESYLDYKIETLSMNYDKNYDVIDIVYNPN